MRICIDLDNTICLTDKSKPYSDLIPLPDAVYAIQEFKKAGHEIIIHSARHMETCNNSLGLIIAKQSKVVIDWLIKWGIPYDEIWLGKPLADVYIDDRGLHFDCWSSVMDKIL